MTGTNAEGAAAAGAAAAETAAAAAAEAAEAALLSGKVTGESLPKYETAARIANEALAVLLGTELVAGARIANICSRGDELIDKAAQAVFAKKEKGEAIKRGVAFPTTVCPNVICANFAPLKSDRENEDGGGPAPAAAGTGTPAVEAGMTLQAGDVVKVKLGCHIGGCIATVAHTVVVPPAGTAVYECPASGPAGTVIAAAQAVLEAAIRSTSAGKTNHSVSQTMRKVAEVHNCHVLPEVLSHQYKQFIIDSAKCILSRETAEERVVTNIFEENEVYGISVFVANNDTRRRESESLKTTIFKRDVEHNYQMKTALARAFMAEVNNKFPSLPFCTSGIEDLKAMRIGLREACRHNLLQPYPVLETKRGDIVAHFEATILVTAKGVRRLTGINYKSVQTVEPEKPPAELPENFVELLKEKVAGKQLVLQKTVAAS